MFNAPDDLWIRACVVQLQRQWRTVDPEVLEDLAHDLARDERLRAMEPGKAALDWLRPINDFELE